MPRKKGVNGHDLKVHLFNVGQGDHIMMELPNGEVGIIDFYYEYPLEEPPTLAYLAHLERTQKQKPVISFIHVSHPDNDHILGVDKFLEWVSNPERKITVKNFWSFPGHNFAKLIEIYKKAYDESDKAPETFHRARSTFQRLSSMQKFVESNNRKRKNKCAIEYFQDIQLIGNDIGGEVKVVSLAPLGEDVHSFNDQMLEDLFKVVLEKGKPGAKKNLVSSVLKMDFRKHTLIFGGDTEGNVWKKILDKLERSGNIENLGPCRGNFVKISHHGSKNSSSETLWDAILGEKKNYIGISAGRRKNLNHPSRETIHQIMRVKDRRHHKVDILSTNACRKCIGGLRLEEEQIEWFDAGAPDSHGIADEGVRQMKPRRHKNQPSPEFLGYTFTFSAKSSNVRVTKMATYGDKPPKKCIYGGTRKPMFPYCAL